MGQYVIAPRAKNDLDAIWDYIGIEKGNPAAAARQIELIRQRLAILATQPLMGQSRNDLLQGLRTFSAGNYVILYYSMKDGVEVAGVVHGAQDIMGMFHRGER